MENYEQKYKAALSWIQTLYEGLHGKTKEEAEAHFPELKESKDERIRKSIHIYLDWLDGRKDYAPKGEFSIKDMIAWLEKQKPVDTSENNGKTALEAIKEVKESGYEWDAEKKELKKIGKKPELKEETGVLKQLLDERSEEDEGQLQYAIDACGRTSTVDRLKSIKRRI